MDSKKSFEELLRDKVEQHEFPYEVGNWAQMQSKLNAHQVQAAASQTSLYKGLLLKAGKVLVAAISGSAIVYSTLSLSGMLDKNEASQTKKIAQQIENTQPQLTEEQQDINKISDKNQALIIPQEKIDQNRNAETNDITYENKNDVKSDVSTDKNAVNDLALNNKIATNKTSKNSSYKNNVIAGNSKNRNKKSLANNKAVDVNNTVQNSSEKSNVIGNDLANVNEQENPYKVSDKNASVTGNEDEVITKPEEEILAADSSLLAENKLPLEGGKYPEKPSAEKPKSKITFGITAGVNSNIYTSFNGGADINSYASLMGGFFASVPLNDKFGLQGGAQYVSHNMENINHLSAVVQYSILQDSSVTHTAITQCRYLEIPLIVKYAVAPRINIYSGLRTGLMMGSSAKITQLQYYNKELISSTGIDNDNNVYAKFDGLRSVNFAVPFGIEYAWTSKISTALNGYVGLTDITNNQVFGVEKRDTHNGVQLLMNYKLF